jgi:hypothetical protein
MGKLWTYCRFLGSIASYYITPTPPDFELVKAECDDEDVTAKLITWIAYGSPPSTKPWPTKSRLVLQYKYKGAGPYLIYFDDGEDFVFPPRNVEETKPLEFCLVSVEVNKKDEEEPLDITDRGQMFAGPDGKWDDRLKRGEEERESSIDLKLLYPDIEEGDEIVISFANGDEIQIKFP